MSCLSCSIEDKLYKALWHRPCIFIKDMNSKVMVCYRTNYQILCSLLARFYRVCVCL